MDPRLAELYNRPLRLDPGYVKNVLKLDGETADRVGRISGGIHKDEAELLARVSAEIDPVVSLEIGLGYGYSALTICSARPPAAGRRHIVIDPHQRTYWKGMGLAHLDAAEFGGIVDFHEDLSYRVLPALERENVRVDLAFVDGWHTFDFAFVDFFFIDKLLREDGVVVFDDADWPSIRPVLRYAVTNLSYAVHATLPEKGERAPFDVALGLEGSCIALRKVRPARERDIFFHRPFS